MVLGNDALLVVDVQQDFLPGGSLAVADGNSIVPVINRLGGLFSHIVLTQDWHPPRHISFATTHGMQPFEHIEASYGPQSLWPEHTVQGSAGADFAPDLDLPNAEMVLRKGFRRHIDSYSAFLENDRRTPTGLAGYLRERGLSRLFVCGLAWDYCVGNTALDGVHLGFKVVVIEDAVRGVAKETTQAMTMRWRQEGVTLLDSGSLLHTDQHREVTT